MVSNQTQHFLLGGGEIHPKETQLKTSHVFGSSIFYEEGYFSPKCTFKRQLINVSLGEIDDSGKKN
jgi:hypothetical protein